MLNERWGRFLRINLSDILFVKKCWHVDGFGLFLKLVNCNKIMTNNKCHLYLKIRASCPLFSIFLAEFFLFLNRGPEAGRCHVSYRLWSPLRQSCDFGQCQIKAKKKKLSLCVRSGLCWSLFLPPSVRTCVGINTAANTWDPCLTMCDGTRTDKGRLRVQRRHKVQCFLVFLQFLDLPLSHCHSLFNHTALPPPLLWLDPLWAELIQSDRTAEPVGDVCVCGCLRVCTVNVWMWDLAYHRDMSHPSLLPLPVCLLYAAHLFW